jgi:hypothetical protein
MLCRNKNIRCNVIANRLSQSSSFPRMLKGDVAISSLETETTFVMLFGRNEVISTLGDCHENPFDVLAKQEASFIQGFPAMTMQLLFCGGCPSAHQCLHRPCCAETKTSGVTSLRITFLNHYHFPKCSKAMWQSPPSETEAPFVTL